MDDCKMTNCETSDSHAFEDNHMKEEPEPVVQGILKDAMSNIAFDSPNLLQSECYAGDDMSTTDSCMSLPASTILLTAKPFKSRIPIRRGGATTPSDYDRMSNHSGRSTPTFRNSLDPMSSSFTNGYVNINHEYKQEDSLPSSFGVVPPSIAPKPAYIKGQLPRRFNKIPLKRETSLPPFSFGTTLSQSQSPQTGKDQTNVLKPVVKPNYVRSNSSLSMYEERKKSRDQHNQQLHKLGYMPALLNSSSRRGSIDNFYGGGGDIESASSTRCSTPNRLMGSLSKIPIWTGSQEKLNTLRQNPISPNSSLQKTTTSSRILPPTPNNVATNVSGNRIGGTVKGKRLNSKKWESCSNLESSTGSASQEGRFKQMAKGKTNRNLELNEKSRQLTESLKQLQQSYSSTNIQADLKKRDMINGNKEDISLDWSMKQITTPSENDSNAITPIIGNSRSVDSYKHQLEEKDKIIAMLRQAIEDGNNGMTLMQSQSLMSRSIDHISSTPLTHDMDGVADKTFNVSTGLSVTENDDAPMLPEVLEMKKSFKERESKLISELQDAKDQAELLEFRVLELEEEQEKQKLQKHENTLEDIKKGTKDVTLDAMNDKKYSDTVSVSGDSGCNLSTSTEPADLTELYQDFRNEKVADTKTRLHELMCHISGPSDKSLLLQTVALFETLLSKIHELQNENSKLKTDQQDLYHSKVSNLEDIQKIHADRDQLVLELEESRNKLNNANQTIVQLTESTNSHEDQVKSLTTDLSRMDAKNAQIQSIHLKQESDLKKQISDLKGKLDSATYGRRAESEMYEEAMVKTQRMETMVGEFNAKIKLLEDENAELREQLSNALEHHTTKSAGSFGSDDFRSNDHHHAKIPSMLSDTGSHHSSENESSQGGSVRKVVGSSSSGVSSDLSDPDSDGGHDDEGSQNHEHHDADDEIENRQNTQSFITQIHGNKRKKDKIMVEISTQTKDEQSTVKMIAHEIDKLTKPAIIHDKLCAPTFKSNSEISAFLIVNEDLEKTREDYQNLVTKKRSVELDVESLKGDNKILQTEHIAIGKENLRKMVKLQEIEHGLRSQLEEWESRYNRLQEKNRLLLEEKCELEEAENDSRLQAQRFEQQNTSAFEKNQLLSEELVLERKTSAILRNELDSVNSHGGANRFEASRLESMLQRYEQRVFDLEEVEVELREKMLAIEFAFQTLYWFWTSIIMSSGCRIPYRPMLVHHVEDGNECQTQKNICSFEVHGSKESEHTIPSNQMPCIQIIDTKSNGNNNAEVTQLIRYKNELEELKTKEVAYKQTITKGDTILAKVEAEYQSTIAKLEGEKMALKGQLLELECRLTAFGKHDGSDCLNEAYTDMSRRLMVNEQTELELKSKICVLEEREKEVNKRLTDQRSCYNDLVNQLQDHDNVIKKMGLLEQENSDLLDQIEHLREVERRFKDVHQSEEFLQGRVEELEQTESALRSELTTVDRRFSDRDCKWQRKVDDLQDELNLHQELKSETSSNNYLSLTEHEHRIIKREHEGRHSLRIQVEGLKQTVDSLNKDIDDKNDQLKSSEASLRSEVIIPTKMTSLTKIQLDSDRVSTTSLGEMDRRVSEDNGVSIHALSDQYNEDNDDELDDAKENKNTHEISDNMDMNEENQMVSSPLPSPLVRYKSLRDHNGRFYLVVKIT